MVIDINAARRVLEVVDCGLSVGMPAKPMIGRMCVENAVCYALGLPHSDSPTCVGAEVRQYKICLNDRPEWPSRIERARGMRRVAIAQLGSDKIDQVKFAQAVVRRVAYHALPATTRVLAVTARVLRSNIYVEALEGIAQLCETKAQANAPMPELSSALYASSIVRGLTELLLMIDDLTHAHNHEGASRAIRAVRPLLFLQTSSERLITLQALAQACEDALRELNSPGIVLLDQLLPRDAAAALVKATN